MSTVSIMKVDPSELNIDRAEALRYAGYRKTVPNEVFESLADEISEKIKKIITPRVVFIRAGVSVNEEYTIFESLKIESKALGRLLKNSSHAYFFAATVGTGVDRFIAATSKRSAAEGVLADACGSAAVEAVCNYVCRKFSEEEAKLSLKRITALSEIVSLLDSNDAIEAVMNEIVKIADNRVCMFGNVGPIQPLWQGTPEEVKADVEKSIDAGFRMIAPGCSFVPMTPGDNLRAMAAAVKASTRSFAKGKN